MSGALRKLAVLVRKGRARVSAEGFPVTPGCVASLSCPLRLAWRRMGAAALCGQLLLALRNIPHRFIGMKIGIACMDFDLVCWEPIVFTHTVSIKHSSDTVDTMQTFR